MAEERYTALTARDEWNGTVATVTVTGEIDMSTVGALSQCLAGVLSKKPARLVIDLAGVSFVDSSAVHAFVQARRALPGDCPVILRSPRPQARRAFELTGLDSLCVVE